MTAHQKPDSVHYATDGLDMTWMEISACSTAGDLPWTSHGNISPTEVTKMRDLCRICPVLSACAGFVEDAGITAGFWAGMSRSTKKAESRAVRLRAEGTQDAA